MIFYRVTRRRTLLFISAISIGVLLLLLNRKSCEDSSRKTLSLGGTITQPPIAWIRGKNQHTGYINHVHEVLNHLGYKVANYSDEEGTRLPWDLLWSHEYPFKTLHQVIQNLKPGQVVNHFPGTGFISNKLSLAESKLRCIPMAFRIPKDKAKLLQFAQDHPDKMFVSKRNNHRGIEIKPLKELNLTADGSFVQEFVHNPLLIDGHKFDIGVYVVLTSVDPLRVYWYSGDVLFRFCMKKYHPFDATITAKYVVGDDYLPTWKVPSLSPYINTQGFGMKDSFDAWLIDNQKDPKIVWDGVMDAIAEVFLAKESSIIEYAKKFNSTSNFFEMFRFDLIIDENLRVYLMEANMSPNLSSSHFKPNRFLYRQVINSVLNVATFPVHQLNAFKMRGGSDLTEEERIITDMKNIVVFPSYCAGKCLTPSDCRETVSCELCKSCAGKKLIQTLVEAHGEHIRRGLCRRIIPKAISNPDQPIESSGLSAVNTLMSEWFRGKCLMDKAFCN